MKQIIEVPHFVQYYNIDDDKWQGRSCGIVCLAMVLDYYKITVDLDELVSLGLKMDGYLNGVGWKHQVICDLAEYYGLESYRTENETIKNLLESLDKNEPVIVSVHKNFDPTNGGHLVVLNGYYISDDELLGFYINDPIGAQYKHKNQFVDYEDFVNGWKKRAIYVKKADSNGKIRPKKN